MKKVLSSNVIAWVDVDSVLVDFYEYFHVHLNDQYGIKLPKDFVPSDWSYADVLHEQSFIEVFNSLPPDWAAHLKVYDGAANFMKELHEMGCYIVLLTHLPESQKQYRLQNLIKNGIYFDEIFSPFGQPKSQVAEMLLPRFESGNGAQIEGFIVDDYFKNTIDMMKLKHVKAGFSLNYPFNVPLAHPANNTGKHFSADSKCPTELYQATLKDVQQLFFQKKG
jgi:hypothetical protein